MFTNLTKFETVRTNLQAFGFYIFYFIAGVIVGGVLGILGGFFGNNSNARFGLSFGLGTLAAAVICTTLTYLVLQKKGLLRETSSVIYLIATVVLGVVGGAILGMILPSYLTTKLTKQASSDKVS